jgi:hypothetical protein
MDWGSHSSTLWKEAIRAYEEGDLENSLKLFSVSDEVDILALDGYNRMWIRVQGVYIMWGC